MFVQPSWSWSSAPSSTPSPSLSVEIGDVSASGEAPVEPTYRNFAEEHQAPPIDPHAAAGLVPVGEPVAVGILLVVGDEAVVVDVERRGLRRDWSVGPVGVRVLIAVRVVQRVLAARREHPERVLVGHRQAVLIEVHRRVGPVERVRVRALARVGQRARVEVQRGLVLVAVGDPVAVGVELARVGLTPRLERVGEAVTVDVRSLRSCVRHACGRAGSGRGAAGRADLGRELRRREGLAEATCEDAQTEAVGAGLARRVGQEGKELGRDLHGQLRARCLGHLDEHGGLPAALEGERVAVLARAEVAAANRQRLADLHLERRDAADDRRLRRLLGLRAVRETRREHDEGECQRCGERVPAADD